MELKIFQFVDEVLDKLEDMRIDLEIASREIEVYLEEIVDHNNEGYLNINSRVKSKQSLKEKILRYDYYRKYSGSKEILFNSLSDLIGVRIECRFIEDENAIYRVLKKQFNVASEDYPGYYYRSNNGNVLLEVASRQPQEQKNGLKIYRIDGKYIYNEQTINFELQIKSLVNIFWSEIEHKVIYKNYNYIIADRFYKDIMRSIKNSLTTIDQQLLLISNEFERADATSYKTRKDQLEKLLSKVIYDLFSIRMKNNIGVLVDFRKSCDTIVKYVFREGLAEDEDIYNYNTTLVDALNRLNAIETQDIDFNKEITFERELIFEDEFSQILGNFMKDCINEDFQWNLFFKVLFEIEPYNNARDFENFIKFYKDSIQNSIQTTSLLSNFSEDETNDIIDNFMIRYAEIFTKINLVGSLYDHMISQLAKIFNNVIEAISRNLSSFEEWEREKDIYLQLFEFRVLSIFNIDIEATKVLDFLDEVRRSESNIEIHKSILKYIDKL